MAASINSRVELSEVVVLLKEVPLFANQNEEVLTTIARDFRQRTYRNKEIVFHQGDLNRSLYVIVQGKVRAYHLTANGEETTVNIMGRRQVLGEFSAVDGLPRSASVQAISQCSLLEMNGERLLHHLERTPGLALAMCRQLTFKVRWTTSYAETIARFDAAGRLQHLLLLYNEQFGQVIEQGKVALLDLGLSQGDLATLVGTTRGWVNEILSGWRNRGLMDFEDGRITILDLERFAAG